ncbi:AI-2E family transporter [Saccharospirillum mangrovi]|uniref:AI-2E family transporter n=1 Tax=Saccharospirillum mangrovi TaxID=2161747 RepID=UPI0027958889|nr:AI-2E family transporter [Saccharospirillum mangrovi]
MSIVCWSSTRPLTANTIIASNEESTDLKLYRVIQGFFQRYFSDEEAVILFILLVLFGLVVYALGQVLAPVFTAVILAYLLSPIVDRLNNMRVPHILSVSLVCLLFFGLLVLAMLIIVPSLVRQVTSLVTELPSMLRLFQDQIQSLPERFPELISSELAQQWLRGLDLRGFSQQLSTWLPRVLTISLNTLPNVVGVLIYLVVVPLMVFFMLKDRTTLWNGVKSRLPARRGLINQIALEMNQQIANYLRGKAIEILIVGLVAFVTFELFGLQYSALLGTLVGLSVLIPYIGATVVTLPVFLIGAFQWGFTNELYYVMLAYLIIQMLDGNVLVPLLFSEAVNLNPVSIIIAVLLFGGLWGFWGVFFAIPLATFVKAIFNAWPQHPTGPEPETESSTES